MKKILSIIILLFSITVNADTLKVRIWSGFAPGGGTDKVVREIQKQILEQEPGAEVVIEYAPGASGVIALKKLSLLEKTQYVELLVDGSNQLITKYLTNTNDVDLEKDIKILMPVGHTQMVIMSSKNSNIHDIKSFQEKAQKNKLNYGSAGSGSQTFSTTAYLGHILGLNDKLVNIPYKGTSLFYVDLISGRIDLASDFLVAGAPHVLSGKVNAVAVTGDKRSSMLPAVPTLKEQGIANFSLSPWFALFVNNTSDEESVTRVKRILVKSFSRSSSIKSFHDMGITVVSAEQITSSHQWYEKEKQIYKNISNKLKSSTQVN